MLLSRRLRLASLLSLLLAIDSALAAAEMPAAARQEVEQLLSRLAGSGCKFYRNGAWHGAAEARSHLALKYQYLLDNKLAGSAEEFIALAGTKSSSSEEAYAVKCGTDSPKPSSSWMETELREIRSRSPAASPPAR